MESRRVLFVAYFKAENLTQVFVAVERYSILKIDNSSKEVCKSNFRQYGQLKSRLEKSSQKKEDQHASTVTRKKIHARKVLGKSRIAVFFQWFVVPDVRKVGSPKRRVPR